MIDREELSVQRLSQMFGMPVHTVKPDVNVAPTVPLFYLKQCHKGDRHSLSLPSDVQSKLASILVTMNEARYKCMDYDWCRNFNSTGVRFSDDNYITLPTYRKRLVNFRLLT